MKAVITNGKGTIELAEIALPECNEYDCLVKMEVCLFCNSTDRHIIQGTFPFEIDYPNIVGHETIGIVESIGKKVPANRKGGAHVAR